MANGLNRQAHYDMHNHDNKGTTLLTNRIARAIAVAAVTLAAGSITALPAGAATKHHRRHHHHHRHVSHHRPSGIPQHNGGDRDADNNGGPSDGDGNI